MAELKTFTDKEIVEIIDKVWEEVDAKDNITGAEASSLFATSQHNKGFNRAKKVLKRGLLIALSYPQILENEQK